MMQQLIIFVLCSRDNASVSYDSYVNRHFYELDRIVFVPNQQL